MVLSSGEIFILISISIIGILVIIVLFWFFLLRKSGNTTGEKCNTDNDCSRGNYCGGGNQCVKGICGGIEGTDCTKNGECKVGFLCVSNHCTQTVPLLPTNSTEQFISEGSADGFNLINSTQRFPIGSFSNRLIVVIDNNSTHYLEVSPTESIWSNIPKFSYNYNDVSHSLTSINLQTGEHKPVKIASNGNLIIDNSPVRSFCTNCNISGSMITIVDNGKGLLMLDQFNNILSVELNNLTALFNNPRNYPQTPSNIKTIRALFQIFESPLLIVAS